jgi:putative oxidoreductase
MFAALSPYALAMLRIVAALLFLEHGSQKLLGFPPPVNAMPSLLSLAGFSGCLELVGGLLLLVGFKARVVAFILSGEMAVAYWMAHAPRSAFPALNGGDAAILYCFIFLYLVVAGPGALSWDEGLRAGPARGDRDDRASVLPDRQRAA